jgi:hypothetical protein
MKCPSCNESLGFYAKKAKKEKDENGIEKQYCPSCNNEFRFGYSGILVFILVLIIGAFTFQIADGSFQRIIAGGITFALAVAIALRPEKVVAEAVTQILDENEEQPNK